MSLFKYAYILVRTEGVCMRMHVLFGLAMFDTDFYSFRALNCGRRRRVVLVMMAGGRRRIRRRRQQAGRTDV